MKTITGAVKPPKDLTPAIEALGDKGRKWLDRITKGREITHHDVAKAADVDNGYRPENDDGA